MIDYLYIKKEKLVIYSNLPSNYTIPKAPHRIHKVKCPITNKDIRHGYFINDDLHVYIVSYDKKSTNKILNYYLDSVIYLIPIIEKSIQNLEHKLNINFRRLKHNIVTHSTNIRQELEKAFPLSNSVKGARNQLAEIKNILENDVNQSAKSILKLIKSSNLLRFEFDIYDLLNSSEPYLEFDDHEIHKIILFNLSPYWFDLIQKKTTINVSDCYDKVYIDPRSISVVLSLLFENATKYIANETELCIKFDSTIEYLNIVIEMTSLKIHTENINEIIKEGISGEYAKKLGLAGDGLGLNIADKLIKYNKGEFKIEVNINESKNKKQLGIPYERNKFILKLKKSL